MEVNKESTESKIIEATIRLLNKEGYSGVTTQKIAKEAGVSEVTIFRKFKNKTTLLETVQNIYAKEFMKKVDEILAFSEDDKLEEYLRRVWNNVVLLSDEHSNVLKIALEEVRETPLEKKVLPRFEKKVTSKISEFLILQIKKGNIRKINTEVASITIFSMIFNAIVLLKIYGETPNENIDSYLNDFLDIFINGIVK